MDLGAVTAEVAVPQIVTVDEDDVRLPRHDGRVGAGRGRVDSPDGSGSGGATKSMSSSTAPRSGVSRSFQDVTLPSTCFQNDAGVAVIPRARSRPPSTAALRDLGPAFDADHRRLDCLPDVDEGMPGDENVPVGDLLGDAGFLGAVDEVVEEDAEAAAIIRAKAAYPLGEIVGALELFDNHALDAKVRPRPSR